MSIVTRANKAGSGTPNYVPNTTILSDEVNLDFNTLYDDYDGNITDANIAVGANIDGAKLANQTITGAKLVNETITATQLADDAVTTVKILDANVTTAKLAIGASERQVRAGVFTPTTVTGAESAPLVTVGPFAYVGAPVHVDVAWIARVIWPGGGGTTIVRLKRNGTEVGQWIFQGLAAAVVTDTLPMMPFEEIPPAGTYTYTVTVQTTGGATFAVDASILHIVEVA
jgi:hypothetical protein